MGPELGRLCRAGRSVWPGLTSRAARGSRSPFLHGLGRSNAKAEQFTKQPLQVAHHAITTAMTQPGLLTPEFTDRMWAAIDEDITLSEWYVPLTFRARKRQAAR